MIDARKKAEINAVGKTLALLLPEFYGKVTFYYQNGVYGFSNVEQSIKPDNPKKEIEK